MADLASPSFPSEEKQSRDSKPASPVVPIFQNEENILSGNESESPQLISAIDHMEEDEIDEIIITAGARSASSVQAEAVEADDDEFTDSSKSTEFNQGEPKAKMPRKSAPGFVLPDELPKWFPKQIKEIYAVDRKGGSLSFKELNDITRYRGLIEILHRRKWKRYLKAGEARYRLQKLLQRLRKRNHLPKAFLEYREHQYKIWEKKALRLWKKLERLHAGTRILDETIHINVRQERMIYAKKPEEWWGWLR